MGPIRALEGVELTSKTYCKLLEPVLLAWLEDLPLSSLRNIIFIHNNVLSHSTKATTSFLVSLCVNDDSLMGWPKCSPDLYPIHKIIVSSWNNKYTPMGVNFPQRQSGGCSTNRKTDSIDQRSTFWSHQAREVFRRLLSIANCVDKIVFLRSSY